MKNNIKSGAIAILCAGLILTSVSFVFAQTSSPSGTPNNSANRISMIKSKADAEIARRITSITDLLARIQTLKRVSDSDKSSLTGMGNTMIANLNILKTKIDADTDIATLRIDWKSIFDQYRVYMLFMPQLRIYVAADRINDTTNLMMQVSAKLQGRINGNAAWQSTLNDANSKITDAETQAQNAINATKGLQPDQGNNAIASSNKQALLSAKGMIMTAITDLQTARTDFVTIINALKVSKSASPSATP